MSDDDQDSLKTLINKKELKSVELATTASSATLTISSIGKTISCTIPVATDTKGGLMSALDKTRLDSAYSMAKTANDITIPAIKETADYAKSQVNALSASKGHAGGLAPLDPNGKVPSANLPGYVDDVIEFNSMVNGVILQLSSIDKKSTAPGCMVVYDKSRNTFLLAVSQTHLDADAVVWDEFLRPMRTNKLTAPQSDQLTPSGSLIEGTGTVDLGEVWDIDDNGVINGLLIGMFTYYASWADAHNFGEGNVNGRVPESGKVYICTSDNKTFRWSGNELVTIGSDLALGHTASTAFPGHEGEALQLSVNDLQGQFYNLESKLRGISILPFNGFYDEYPDQGYGVWFRYSADENGGQAYMWAEEYPEGYSFDDYNITFRGFSVIRPDRLYRCGDKIYKVVGKVLYEFVTEDQLLESLESMKQTINTEIDELHEEINEYADDAAQAEAQNVKTSIGIQEFAGIAGSQGSCYWVPGETYWIAADKCFMRDHAVVWTDKKNTPLRTQLYRYKNDLYRVVRLEGKQYELYKLVSTDELEGAVEPVTKELSRKAQIITFDGKYENLEEAEWVDGNIYWVDGEGFYECKEVDGEQQYVALYPDGYDTILNNCLFTDGDYLYWVCGGVLTRIAEGWEIEDQTNVVDSLIPRVGKLESNIGDLKLRFFDTFLPEGEQNTAGLGKYWDEVNSEFYDWPAGQESPRFMDEWYIQYVDDNGNDVGFVDPNYIYIQKGTGKLYLAVKGELFEFATRWDVEAAKRELFADLWESHFTAWTPFGGVAGNDNKLPHFSLKIGGVKIDENGYRRYKLFGFNLSYEKALEVLAKPDPACFNGIGSINAYLSKFSNKAGVLDLTIPRQPLQYFAGNFDYSVSQFGLRSIILPQITLSTFTYPYSLAEAIMVYGVASANALANCTQLRELYLLLPPQSLNLSNCPQLSEESVVRLIELSLAYEEIGINISTTLALHPAVYDALSDETFELASSSRVTIIRANS